MATSAAESIFNRALLELRVSGALTHSFQNWADLATETILHGGTVEASDALLRSTVLAAVPTQFQDAAVRYFKDYQTFSDALDVLKEIQEWAEARGLAEEATRRLMRTAVRIDSAVYVPLPVTVLEQARALVPALTQPPGYFVPEHPVLLAPDTPFAQAGLTYRSRLNALGRTMSTGLSGQMARFEAQITGQDLRWVTVGDHRVRDAHRAAQGQTVGYDEWFLVGGTPMEYPGDPAAPTDLTVNCRCVLALVTPPERRYVQNYIPRHWLAAAAQSSTGAPSEPVDDAETGPSPAGTTSAPTGTPTVPVGLTAAAGAPTQARAPQGTPIGGQWIDTPTAILRSLNRLGPGVDVGNTAPTNLDAADAERVRLADGVLKREGRPGLQETADRVGAIYDMTTPAQRHAGDVWYDEARVTAQGMVADSGGTLSEEQAAAVIAHLSTRTAWPVNVIAAQTLARGGTIEEANAAIKAAAEAGLIPRGGGILTDNWAKAKAASVSADPIGRRNLSLGTFSEASNKTRTFASNILGDGDGVTVDTWMYRVLGQSDLVTGKMPGVPGRIRKDQVYESLAEAVRVAAKARGVNPVDMQGATWLWALESYRPSRGGKPGVLVDAGTGTNLPVLIGEPLAAAVTPLPTESEHIDDGEILDYWRVQAEKAGYVIPPGPDHIIASGGPDQVRAPKGTAVGGQWIDTPAGLARQVQGLNIAIGALGKPGEPRSYDDLDNDFSALINSTNPGWNSFPNNPAYQENCQRVVAALEMRARGFDDTVANAFDGTRDSTIDIENCWVDPATGSVRLMGDPVQPNQAHKILDGYAPGSRFIMAGWSESEQFGHVWNAEMTDHGLLEVDAQGGSREGETISDAFDEIQWLRVDDLTPTDTLLGGHPPMVTGREDMEEPGRRLLAAAGPVDPIEAGKAAGYDVTEARDLGDSWHLIVADPERHWSDRLLLMDKATGVITLASRFVAPLTAAAPSQARAPKGTRIGGQWIDTPGGMLAGLSAAPGAGLSVDVGGSVYTGTPSATHGREADIQAHGLSTPTLYHSKGDPASAQAFQNAIQRAKDANPYGASVYVYDLADYQDMDLWLTEDGMGGIALHGDDIVSAFNTPGSTNKGFVQHAMATAQAAGGTHADAFDTVLPKLYAQAGMEVVARTPWNDDYAPDGWDYDQFGKFNGGRPDVVFLKFNPDGWWGTYTPGQGQVVDGYDEGVALTASAQRHVDGLVVPLIIPRGRDRLRGGAGTKQALYEAFTVVLAPAIGHLANLHRQPGSNPGSEFVRGQASGSAPTQARAPQGTPIGGQWIDTPSAILHYLGWAGEAPDTPDTPYTVTPASPPPNARPEGYQRGLDKMMPGSENLSQEQKWIVEQYGGQAAFPMNEYLRTGDVGLAYKNTLPGDMQEHIDTMDSVMAGVPGDLHTYRGVGAMLNAPDPDRLIGTVIRDDGYLSTSLDATVASTYFGGYGPDKGILKISVPKGHPAIWVENMSTVSGEMELILPHGQNLAITGWYDDEKLGTRVYEASIAEPVSPPLAAAAGKVEPPLDTEPLFDVEEGEGEHQTWETHAERDDRLANPSLTAAAPNQARAPKGTRIGGQWIDTPAGMLDELGSPAIVEPAQWTASQELRDAMDVVGGYGGALPRYDERTAANQRVEDAMDLPMMIADANGSGIHAEDAIRDARGAWAQTAPEELSRGMKQYTEGDYWTVNAMLRGQTTMRKHGTIDEMVPIDPKKIAYLQADVDAIRQHFHDHAMVSGPGTTAAYRGFDTRVMGGFPVGSFAKDDGLASASMSALSTSGFGDLFALEVPPGTRYVYGNAEEKEVIFEPGSIFERVDDHVVRVHPPAAATAIAASGSQMFAVIDEPGTVPEGANTAERFTQFAADVTVYPTLAAAQGIAPANPSLIAEESAP